VSRRCDKSHNSSPGSFWKSSITPSWQRMDSPTGCATVCAMPTADESSQLQVRYVHTAVLHTSCTLHCAANPHPKICPFRWDTHPTGKNSSRRRSERHSNQWRKTPKTSPFPWGTWTPSNTLMSGPTPLATHNDSSIGSRTFAQLCQKVPLLTMGRPTFTPKIAPYPLVVSTPISCTHPLTISTRHPNRKLKLTGDVSMYWLASAPFSEYDHSLHRAHYLRNPRMLKTKYLN